MPFDNLCKYLSEKYPVDFAEWILGKPVGRVQVLKTELSHEPIHPDSLSLLQTPEQILHLEFQVDASSDPPLPLRMLDYWVRLFRKYRLPVIQVVILLKESSVAETMPEEFIYGETRHRYRVLRIWRQSPESFLYNPALLPLAVLSQTQESTVLLKRVAEEINKVDNMVERREILTCTEILAGLRFNKDLIRKVFKEGIMRESVIYQEIIQEGMERGLERGLEQGLEQGHQQGESTILLRQLQRRFGNIGSDIQNRIQQLSVPQLEELAEALLDFNHIDDLQIWLKLARH